MRGVTIVVAIVVGLTWALTLCDAEPNRILNPFRNRGKTTEADANSGPIQSKYGKFSNTERFGRQLDDKFLLKGRMARRANAAGDGPRKNKIADEK